MLRPDAVRSKGLAFRFAAVAAVIVFGAASVAACSNQGEGERCSQLAQNGGNDDCQDGLVCTSSTDLGTGSDICCPQDRTQATTAVCAIKRAPVGGDAGIPGDGSAADTGAQDTGTQDTATQDAPAESAAETGTDGATD